MEEGVALDEFCGSKFWDANVTWYTDNPDFTPCFERTVLVWIPCFFLWVFAPMEVFYIRSSPDRLVPWSWCNVSKLIGSALLMTVQCVDFFHAVYRNANDEVVYGVDYAAPAIIFFTILLQVVFILMEKKRGIQSSGVIFMFWLFMVICGIPEYRTYFINILGEETKDDVIVLPFVTYMVYFPLIVVMLILNCFGDATPEYLDFDRGEKPCPEVSASFFNRILFAWMDALIWKGYRNPLEMKDLWSLTYENASRTIVRRWNRNWGKSLAKREKKAERQAWSTANNANEVELKGMGKDKKKQVSILPTMVRTFGPTFLFGATLKLFHDCLQFVSPQILSALIVFTESEDMPAWKGYMYAALMFVCAQIQSLVLGQYFMKMFLAGLRIRTGVISAVYRKALRISSSARKESTVGEIVNLMSVDAQRFMDLTSYINMLWSAPLQIALALYFLWGLLGPSVLAGLAVMIVLIPVNGFIANKTKQFQISQMKNKDHRVKLMNEILNGIKVLKLYAWEPSFEDQVLHVRNEEIKVLKKSAYLNAGTSFIWTCTPFLVTFVMFATYVLTDPTHILTAEKIFTSITLLNILRMPMTMLPFLIVAAVQANVSLTRLNKFLNADELDPDAVTKDRTLKKPITVENGTFSWGVDDEDGKAVLHNLNLDIEEGSLVAVVGSVGAGKSSLCSAILGEMEKLTGRVNINGDIAYVAQQAWIQNATLEDNILFNNKRDDDRYTQCVQACALQSDLDMLPGGDQTEIGEKGINLSGGQKQRVSLARAVYSNADIYLLDDPLSAVDSHVGKHIFENVIGPEGVLKGKTRILVTHGLTYLPKVEKIVVLKKGVITEQGTYKELIEKKGEFQEFLLQYLSEEIEDEEELEGLEDIKMQLESALGKEGLQRQISRTKRESESESIGHEAVGEHRGSLRRRSKKISESEKPKPAVASPQKPDVKVGQKLIEKEKAETGKVQLSVYGYYIKAIGILSTSMTVLFYVLSQACTVGSNVWLTAWSSESALQNETGQDPAIRDKYLGVYGALGIGQALTICLGSLIIAGATVSASKLLHKMLLDNVMHSPMSFFDMTPIGRIVNRFSKDLDTVDVLLPSNLRAWVSCLISVVATFLAIIYATPIFVVVMVPTMIIYYFVQVLYVSTSRQLKRIESVSRSPIYSHFQESIQGASTIRAFGRANQFMLDSEKKVDTNQISSFPSVMANRWLAIRLEFIGNIMTFFASLFAVLGRDTISSGLVGLSVSYALSVTQTLNWLVRMTSDVETNIVAVERIKEYTETTQEAEWEIPMKKPEKDWPQHGVVKFNKYSTRYREGLDLVVRDIDCQISGGEKIGIVGRTGAGKSSLTLALFRIIEAAGGNITIDNIDISNIGLHDVRRRLTIIPQDPVLFSGTLRMNLDPFNSYNDEKVWSALEHSHLKEFVSQLGSGLQHEVSEGGENLSVGQRQLVCLARALLRKTRVLVLDEATAAVDLETDDLIQQTIRREFADCTVITIAHRLNTIMDSSRVLVLDKGEIREFDTPENLLKDKKSVFYSMARDAGLV
ncbi:multidrug resistance-associated protein 1-like isoform X1 [Penaeus japonicus]|uniref:multidrug resistance-associated protein 1-like isoform X1 n=1 Tax=Penaeus japonicus TaxID=27405 RepID=UPI001C7128C4|nr:multidrug resistance-associated protein 1-like isoform X1 [Penaeus japonicus]XP_042863549.1 multidrug resistance-associated protein 1-like isoform X1 [Penaeus japonicus]XP_042887270.1 multidrug resistance-associated protein 1-like isoform X1 [Penaeus japonicus]